MNNTHLRFKLNNSDKNVITFFLWFNILLQFVFNYLTGPTNRYFGTDMSCRRQQMQSYFSGYVQKMKVQG